MSYPRKQRYIEPVVWPDADAVPAFAHMKSRQYLESRGISKEESYEYDLAYCDGGLWKGRLLIPCYDEHGNLEAFQGRSLDGSEPRYRTSGPRPAYVPLRDRLSAQPLVLVEGPFDCFAVARVTPNVIATLGTQFSRDQVDAIVRILKTHQMPSALIMFDRDVITEAYALQMRLQPYIVATVIAYAFSVQEKDPGSLHAETIRTLIEENV